MENFLSFELPPITFLIAFAESSSESNEMLYACSHYDDDLSRKTHCIERANHLPNYVANFRSIPGFIAGSEQSHVPHRIDGLHELTARIHQNFVECGKRSIFLLLFVQENAREKWWKFN